MILFLPLGLTAQETEDISKNVSSHFKFTRNESYKKFITSLNLSNKTLDLIAESETRAEKVNSNKSIPIEKRNVELYQRQNREVIEITYYTTVQVKGEPRLKTTMITLPIERQSVNAQNLVSSLEQNYPNPFVDESEIRFNLQDYFNSARIIVSDVNGSQLFIFDSISPDDSHIKIKRDRLSKGVYFYHLEIDGNIVSTKKMVVH